MPYPLWPESLPCPLREGFSADLTPSVRRVAMESGLDRVTRVSSSSLSSNAYSMICNAEQVAEFDSFFDTDANAGADYVLIPMVTSNKLLPHKCRIVPPVHRAPHGSKMWKISFSVETAEQRIDWRVGGEGE